MSPKQRKTLRMMAAAIGQRQKLGSVDVVLDLGEGNLRDPFETILIQHWRAVSKVIRDADNVDWLGRTWEVLWSRLNDKHRWKRVAGPLAALVCYLKDLGVRGDTLKSWKFPSVQGRCIVPGDSDGPLLVNPMIPHKGPAVESGLVRTFRDLRLSAIASQDSGAALRQGIDWTVPKSILKRHAKASHQLRYYRGVWQGAVLTTSKSRSVCKLCGVDADLHHILYDCKWWSSQQIPLPLHWEEIGKRLPHESLWNRGLVPKSVTLHPMFTSGIETIEASGLWLHQQVIPTKGLVFGTDASGGAGSADHRTRVVSWSVVAAKVEGQSFEVVATLSGREPLGTTVTQGEAKALSVLLQRTSGPIQVVADSAAAISQAEAKTWKQSHWPIWGDSFEERHRLQTHWIKSHLTKEEFLASHERDSLWKWRVNQEADQLCGARSAEVFSTAHAAWVARVDKLAAEVNDFLAARMKALITASLPPPAAEILQKPKLIPKRDKPPAPQPRLGADGGLNKKERLQKLIDHQPGGHNWVWSVTGSNNCSIKCTRCTLYIQQTHPLDVFAKLENQTCKDQPMEWPSAWHLAPDHVMHNLGCVFICRKCHATVRIASRSTTKKLQDRCTGMPTRRAQGFALWLTQPEAVQCKAQLFRTKPEEPSITDPRPRPTPQDEKDDAVPFRPECDLGPSASASLRGTVLNDSGEGLRRIRESTDVTGVSGSTHPIPGPLAAPKPAPRKMAPKPKTQPRKESFQPSISSMFAAAQGRNNSSQR